MLFYDLSAKAEADTHSFRFGSKERNEYLFLQFHGNALPIIGDADVQFVSYFQGHFHLPEYCFSEDSKTPATTASHLR